MTASEHSAVDGGFVCENCGATRQTPLGISRHRSMCNRRSIDTDTDRSDDDLVTDGGIRGPPGRRRTETPEWEIEGGEGLPLAHDYRSRLNNDAQIWLFTCCGCGTRLIDPPGPPAGTCSCGGEWVCHRFDPKEYVAIRRFDDPRRADEVATDGGDSQ